MAEPPALVTLHVWGTPALAGAARMATQRSRLPRVPGCSFAKLLGTGDGRTFSLRDADPSHWAVLTCWEDQAALEAYERSALFASWHRVARERCRFLLRPLRSRGRWSGRRPFGEPAGPYRGGPVAAVTRARVRPLQWRSFARSVPQVASDAHAGHGLQVALAIGEAPVGYQGTFTVWRDLAALQDFSYHRAPHAEVIRRTTERGWYSEQLFARFALLEASGQLRGASVDRPPDGRGGQP